jgi:hypothetical protein
MYMIWKFYLFLKFYKSVLLKNVPEVLEFGISILEFILFVNSWPKTSRFQLPTSLHKKTPHSWRAFSLKIYKQHLVFMNVARFDVGALGNY